MGLKGSTLSSFCLSPCNPVIPSDLVIKVLNIQPYSMARPSLKEQDQIYMHVYSKVWIRTLSVNFTWFPLQTKCILFESRNFFWNVFPVFTILSRLCTSCRISFEDLRDHTWTRQDFNGYQRKDQFYWWDGALYSIVCIPSLQAQRTQLKGSCKYLISTELLRAKINYRTRKSANVHDQFNGKNWFNPCNSTLVCLAGCP